MGHWAIIKVWSRGQKDGHPVEKRYVDSASADIHGPGQRPNCWSMSLTSESDVDSDRVSQMRIESVCSERPPLEERERQTAGENLAAHAIEMRSIAVSLRALDWSHGHPLCVCLWERRSAESHEKHVELWKE